MKRRDFLTGVAAGAVVGAAGGGYVAARTNRPMVPAPQQPAVTAPAPAAQTAPAIAKGVRELKMVTTWPKSFPGLGTGAQRVADRIGALSDDKLKVNVFAAGELVPPQESFDAVANGTADMYHGAESFWQSKSPAFNFFATVPAGLTAAETAAWIHHGGGQELWDNLASGFNIKPLLCGNTGVQMAGWFMKDVESLDALKGFKLRMPGLGGEVMRRLGATVVSLPGQEIFPALQAGTIDAAEWYGPWNDLAFGFYKIVKKYYGPGILKPSLAVSLGINKTIWNDLPRDHQYLLLHVASAEEDYLSAEFNARNGEALAMLVDEQGVQLRQFPGDALKAIGAASVEVVAEVGGADATAKKVYDSYVAFRKTVSRWTALSEKAYTTARSSYFPA